MIKGILFDKDGTLIDFNKTWLAAYIQASEFLANSVNRPELATQLLVKGGFIPETGGWVTDSLLASGSNAQIMAFWGEQLGGDLNDQQLTGIREIFFSAVQNHVAVLDDMPAFLVELKNRGIAIGVATMDDERHAYSTLRKLGLQGYFDFVCGADSGYGVKPDPGMINAFSQRCAIKNNQVMMVGDSPKDLNMGRNAGVALTVGVLTGAHEESELAPICDHVFPNIAGIISLLEDVD